MYIIRYVYWTIYHLIFVIYVIRTYQVNCSKTFCPVTLEADCWMVVIFHSKSRKFNLHKQDIQDIANTGKPEVLFLFEYFCELYPDATLKY